MKVELSKILSKLAQSNDASIDKTETVHDNLNQSMENNVGDSNHASMMNDDDDTVLFDDTANQTAINTMEQDSILPATNLSNEESQNNINGDGFTMEIVEVDVVAQTSLELLPTVQIKKSNDEAESTMHKDNDSSADFDESQNENAYNSSVAPRQISSNESFALENDISSDKFTHALNAEMVAEDAHDGRAASTPKKLTDEMNIDAVNSNMDINIEDLPIVMKSDDSEDQM